MTLKFHIGGKLHKDQGWEHIGGEIVDRRLDPDKLSYLWLLEISYAFGYKNIDNKWCRDPIAALNLEESFRLIKDDVIIQPLLTLVHQYATMTYLVSMVINTINY